MFNRNSSVEWVQMKFMVPTNAILREYKEIKHTLVNHRPEDGHKDWYAVTLFGFGSWGQLFGPIFPTVSATI